MTCICVPIPSAALWFLAVLAVGSFCYWLSIRDLLAVGRRSR